MMIAVRPAIQGEKGERDMAVEQAVDREEEQAHTDEDADTSSPALDAEGEKSGAGGDTEKPTAPTDEQQSEETSESLEVHFGDEKPTEDDQAPAPAWVREVRKQNRELLKKNKELERRLSEIAEKPPAVLSAKPTLEQFDFDSAKYEQALASWFDAKRKHDEQQEQAHAKTEREKAEWQAKLDGYTQEKVNLKAADYEDAEEVVQTTLDVTQQGIIIQGAENPALLVYALGKNEKKAKELAAIKDPVKFAFAVAKLEASMKVNRKSAPAPEKPVAGATRPGGSSVDSQLSRLRAEAERTGDYTKVTAYRKQLRSKGR
jgi:hypothetical protein